MNLYWAYKTIASFVRITPRPFAYWCGLRMADRYFARRGEDYRAIVSNLRQIYEAGGIEPADDVMDGMARKTYQYYGKYLVDFFRFTRLTDHDIKHLISIEHYDYAKNAYDDGRGVIFVTAHLGNWEIGGAVVAKTAFPLHVVYRPEKTSQANQFFQKTRMQRGMHIIPFGHAVKPILKLLRNGEAVSLLADRDFSSRDDRIPFFGKPARLPRGPALLSLKTGAPIVPGFLIRQVDDTFLLRFHKPLDPHEIKDEYEMRCQMAGIVEQEIAENPNQWFVFEDFWK